MTSEDRGSGAEGARTGRALDVERDSDVPISTQIYWQLAYQIDSGPVAARFAACTGSRAGCGPAGQPEHDPRGLPTAGRCRLRHESPRSRHARRRASTATARDGGARRDRLGDAPAGGACGFHGRRAGGGDLRRRHRAEAPGPLVRVLYAECTNADAGYDAERLGSEFPDLIEAEGALLDDLPDRLERFHYDLVATTTFHADEAQALVAGRVPVVAMLVGPAYVELVHEIAGLPTGSTVGLICASGRGSDNIRETLAMSGATGVEIVSALIGDVDDLERVDRTADVILMSREALAAGLERTFSRPDRIREWTYDFDPSGLELLRRAIDHAAASGGAEPLVPIRSVRSAAS